MAGGSSVQAPVPNKTRRPKGQMHVKSVEVKILPLVECGSSERGVPAQVSFSSLYRCCFLCPLISTASDPGPRISSWQGARCTPVVDRNHEHHIGEERFSSIPPVLWKNTLWVVRGVPSLFLFHQPHARTCGSTAI
ncbi:hypothetical protein TNCV_267601 [Trichonephila clavipes]|nr:hypothetical protein TNCV_267601 [Trichonephila clavipes]